MKFGHIVTRALDILGLVQTKITTTVVLSLRVTKNRGLALQPRSVPGINISFSDIDFSISIFTVESTHHSFSF